jgi:1-deoxy-D-xylulose-5-phosphate synthase
MEEGWEPLPIGKAEVLRHGDDVLILGYGSMVYPALQTAEILSEHGVQATVINARFAKPIDEELILPAAERIGRVVTMEEGCIKGGFGTGVAEALLDAQIPAQVVRLGVPDVLVDHATPEQSKVSLGLTPSQMAGTILSKFKLEEATVALR